MWTTGIALIVPISFSQIDKPPTSVVDMVVVTTDATELARGRQVLATLMKGERLRVGAIRGVWLGTQITREGKGLAGWVNIRDVMIESDPRSRHFGPHDARLPDPSDDAEDSRWHQSLPQYTEVTERGEVVLDVDTALLLARIHSPAYQRQLETLYRSALNISTQRNSGDGSGTASAKAAAQQELTALAETLLRRNFDAFQRYRQGFYTWIAVGDLGVSELVDSGGLDNCFGSSSSNLRRHSPRRPSPDSGHGTGFAAGGAGQVGGFIGLLQQLQQIRNARDSLHQQLQTLSLLEGFLDAGLIDLTQVDQFRQGIETERANLVHAQNNLEHALDSYKTGTLGLPPDVPIELDDDIIRQFQLIDPELTGVRSKVSALHDQLVQLPEEPKLTELERALKQAGELPGLVSEQVDAVEFDLARLDECSVHRIENMTDAERRLFSRNRGALMDALNDLIERSQKSELELEQLRGGLQPATRRQTAVGAVVWLSGLLPLLQELSLVQARARLESIVLEPAELESEDAFHIALANRLDLMNNRAALVDTWRSIAPSGTVEPNNYRQSLIAYERDRRDFIQSVDAVHRDLRQLLRRLEGLRINLEIQRRAVAITIRRVDVTQEGLNLPVAPPAPGWPAAQFGPNAALNLLTALSDLRNAQNILMSVWLNYYAGCCLCASWA